MSLEPFFEGYNSVKRMIIRDYSTLGDFLNFDISHLPFNNDGGALIFFSVLLKIAVIKLAFSKFEG